jgi:hypothetical protein
VKEIDKACQVPLESTFYPNPFRIPPKVGLDPRILGMPDGENSRFPSKVWKELREFKATGGA